MAEKFDNSELLKKRKEHIAKHGKDVPWVVCPWNDPCCDKGSRCGTSSYIKEYAKKDPDFKKRFIEREREAIKRLRSSDLNKTPENALLFTPTLNINVHFHVLLPDPTIVTNAQLTENINAINFAFTSPSPGAWASVAANTGITFSWNPNDRTDRATNDMFFSSNDFVKSYANGGTDPVDLEHKLNLWICDLGGGLLGYATFPDPSYTLQGVVVTVYSLLPPHGSYPYDQAKSLVHEIGHYFNLRHIWGDGDCTVDDFVEDTPLCSGYHSGCPTGADTCTQDSLVDMIENYMDYTDDACMGLFTDGQAQRMRDCINNLRPGLLSGGGGGGGESGGSGVTVNPNNITCVKSKSVDVKKNYLADNINWQDIITTNLEVFFVNTGDQNALAAWISLILTYFNNGNVLNNLTIGSVTFSNCRITGFSVSPEPESLNNAIKTGFLNITIEEKVSGDLSNIINDTANFENSGNNLGTLLETHSKSLDSITEEINYETGLNGQLSLTHSVSVTPNEYSTSIDNGLTIARQILDSYLPKNSSSAINSSIHDLLVRANGVVGNLSASINRITGEASFTRTINLLSNRDQNYNTTYEYTHTLDLNAEGIVRITENGKILTTGKHGSNASSFYTNAVNELPNQLTEAATRCSNVYSAYCTTDKFDKSFTVLENNEVVPLVIPPLNLSPIETSKNFNEISQEISYSIVFTNDENILTDYTIDRTTDINKNENGVPTLVEKTSFIRHKEKCDSTATSLLSVYNTDVANALTRIQNVWSSFINLLGKNGDFKLISKDLGYNPNGKNLSYSMSYSAEETISAQNSAQANAGIKKISISTSDTLPQRMIQEYPIVGKGILVHNPGQTNLGSRTVTITANLDRINAYRLMNPVFPTNAINYLSGVARGKLLNVFKDLKLKKDDIYVSEISYDFDSKRSLNLTATAQYLQAR